MTAEAHHLSWLLTVVGAARANQLRADAAYLAAIREAREAGYSYTAIGLAAGVTRQAARLSMVRNQGG